MIETGRLTLRPVEPDDLDVFAGLMADPECTRWFLRPGPKSQVEAAAALDRYLAEFAGGVGMYTLVRGGRTIGFAGYVRRRMEWGPELELGWFLLRSFWGNGYATEAARALRPLAPGRVISLIHPQNAASIAVALKLGMELEREVAIFDRPVAVYASESAFEQLVRQALDALPADLAARMSNVAVVVEDEPPPGENLLGLYRGVPLTRRGSGYAGMLPDTITIYRRPLERHYGSDPQRLAREVRRTVLHEIAHHFGISDERLIEIDRY